MNEVHRLRKIVAFLTERLKAYEPNIEATLRSYVSRQVQRGNKKKKWESVAESLISNVPSAKGWHQKQLEIGIGSTKDYESAIRLISTCDSRGLAARFYYGQSRSSEGDPVGMIEAYARITAAASRAADFTTALYLFRGLILVSVCAVLEKQGDVSVDRINKIMRTCLSSDAAADHLKRMRRAAVFVNKLICRLSRVGWTIHRATELFFLCGQSIHRYVLFMNDNCQTWLLERLKDAEFTKHDFGDCLRPEFTIPGFVCALCPDSPPDFVWKTLCDSKDVIPGNIFKVHESTHSKTIYHSEFKIEEYSPSPPPPQARNQPLRQRSLEQLTVMDPRIEWLRRSSKTSGVISLLLILCFLGGSYIPKTILTRGCSPRRRWDDSGEIKEVTPLAAGLDPDLYEFLSNDSVLDQAIQRLVLHSLMEANVSADGHPTFTLDPSLQRSILQELSQAEKEKWSAQAWVLACQAFFRGSSLEFMDASTVRAQSLHLQHALDYHGASNYQTLPAEVKIDLAATLLTASAFPPETWKKRAVTVAKQIVGDLPQCYLHVWAARREVQLSPVLRCSDQVGIAFTGSHLQATLIDRNTRLYAQYGRFLVSFAEKLLQHNEIDEAKLVLHRWKPPDDLDQPALVRKAVIRWKFAMAKALRYEGQFSQALGLFQELLHETTNEDPSYWIRSRVVSHLADVWCELREPKSALQLLLPQIQQYTDLGNNLLAMSLVPSTAESLSQEGQWIQAEAHLSRASDFYNDLSEPNNTTKLTHVRVCFGLAKIATLRGQWEDALSRWMIVLDLTQRYGWGQGFTCGMVNLSISHVTARLGSLDTSQGAMRIAREILDREGWKQHWLAMATHWLDYLQSTLQVEGAS